MARACFVLIIVFVRFLEIFRILKFYTKLKQNFFLFSLVYYHLVTRLSVYEKTRKIFVPYLNCEYTKNILLRYMDIHSKKNCWGLFSEYFINGIKLLTCAGTIVPTKLLIVFHRVENTRCKISVI